MTSVRLTSQIARNMSEFPKFPFGIKNRRREPDEWDKTIVAFQSPYRLKDLCLDQSLAQADDTTRVDRQEFKVRLATTQERRQSASLLIEKMYNWRGYDAAALGQDPNKITLVAYQDDRVVGTMTLGLDRPGGMVVDELYKHEADRLRKEGRRICDITRLAVDRDIKSKSVLAALFHMTFIYGHNIHNATDILIEVNPRHVLFYQRMLGFEVFGEEKLCPRVNAPAVLLRLDLAYADAQIIKYGGTAATGVAGSKSIYPYFFTRQDELGITQRLLRGE